MGPRAAAGRKAEVAGYKPISNFLHNSGKMILQEEVRHKQKTITKWEWVVPVLAVVSLTLSCVWVSEKKYFWNDELYSLYFLSDPTFSGMLSAFHDKINNTPFLYFLLGWGWDKVLHGAWQRDRGGFSLCLPIPGFSIRVFPFNTNQSPKTGYCADLRTEIRLPTCFTHSRKSTCQYPPPTFTSLKEDTPMSAVRLIQDTGTSLTL